MTRTLNYAGIGSRQTPTVILQQMTFIGAMLAKQGYILRSGGAEGADSAFENGCNLERGLKEIYLPWDGYNGRKSSDPKPNKEAYDLAARFHPAWDRLRPGVQTIMARNGYQIFGANLTNPVSFVVCYTPNGAGSGGTGQALRMAHAAGIPVIDLGRVYHPEANTDERILHQSVNSLLESAKQLINI